VAPNLRGVRRATAREAERLRAVEVRLAEIQALIPVPPWPQERDYDESMASDEALALAQAIEHVRVDHVQPAIAALDQAAASGRPPDRSTEGNPPP
jgi:hypothetical protein